jgi:hypothetical protein
MKDDERLMITTIPLHNYTKEKLEQFRKFPNESWEDILLRVLDFASKVLEESKRVG